jgi:hypothetical protein
MIWAGVAIKEGIPVNGRRVPLHWLGDWDEECLYGFYDEELYAEIY